MCGIAVLFNSSGISKNDKKLLENMSERIKHRGPDGKGFFYTTNLGMAHRRLSILDISEHGSQPMSYLDRYTIVYNGEIYNYIEIREDLKSKGYCFQSNADTEVLLAAYDYYGVECLNLFNGMWAFALFDKKTNHLLISRDRFGVKPLYYFKKDRYFLLASEIKAILCDPGIERKANSEIIYDYLKDGLLDHTNHTFFQEIEKFPAGAYLSVSLDNPQLWEFKEYYKADFKQINSCNINQKELVQKFRRLFDDAVKKRLRADVNVGSCLSGGLDSSAIVTAVYNIYKKREKEQHTFSFCPRDKKISEKQYVEDVLRNKKINSHIIDDQKTAITDDFETLIDTQDEPFGSMSIYASYLIYKCAGEGNPRITVLLDGQGADEILCGYRKSRIYYIKGLLKEKHYFTAGKELILSISQMRTTNSVKNDLRKIKNIFSRAKGVDSRRKYFTSEFAHANSKTSIYKNDNFQNVDVNNISLPVLLRYADRNSMASSVESRLPFLDFRLVDLCAEIPLFMKIKNGYSKYIMRLSLDMPESIRRRKSKYGFFVPEKMWLKNNENYFKAYFNSKNFRSAKFIDRLAVLNDWESLMGGQDEAFLFRAICLEAWMRHFNVQSS